MPVLNFKRKPEAQPLTFDDVMAANQYKPVPAVPQKTNVVEAFNAMALNERPNQHLQHPPRGFPGGFHAPHQSLPVGHYIYAPAPKTGPGELPRPPAMPQPRPLPQAPGQDQRTSPGMSRTMQHALGSPPHRRVLKPTPSITPHPSPYRFDHKQTLRPPPPDDDKRRRSDVTINITPPAGRSSPPVTPKRPARARASSSPPPTVSSPSGTSVQCNGVTKAGNRCRKMIKVTSSSPDDQDKHFCHQHSKEVLSPTGTYSRKNGDWIKFADWVPSYLHPDTQIALREEMDKARSSSDRPGYIYTFEIRDPDSPSTVKLKVGRAVNLVKRIDEWNRQCGSKEQVLRGFYPGIEEDGESDGEETFSLMKGRVRPGQKTSCCHRLERLIHLELGDLIASQIYLDAGWPGKVSATAVDKGPRKALKREKCSDCSQIHKEIFEFSRIRSGRYKNQEFDRIVKPVIEKWGAFVEAYI